MEDQKQKPKCCNVDNNIIEATFWMVVFISFVMILPLRCSILHIREKIDDAAKQKIVDMEKENIHRMNLRRSFNSLSADINALNGRVKDLNEDLKRCLKEKSTGAEKQ